MEQAIHYAQLAKNTNEYLSCLYDIAQVGLLDECLMDCSLCLILDTCFIWWLWRCEILSFKNLSI